MWCHGTVAELLGEAAAAARRMPDAAYVQVTERFWRIAATRAEEMAMRLQGKTAPIAGGSSGGPCRKPNGADN